MVTVAIHWIPRLILDVNYYCRRFSVIMATNGCEGEAASAGRAPSHDGAVFARGGGGVAYDLAPCVDGFSEAEGAAEGAEVPHARPRLPATRTAPRQANRCRLSCPTDNSLISAWEPGSEE